MSKLLSIINNVVYGDKILIMIFISRQYFINLFLMPFPLVITNKANYLPKALEKSPHLKIESFL